MSDETEPRVTDVLYGITPAIDNPFPVYVTPPPSKTLQPLQLVGAAVVSFINGAVAVRLILDPHFPEVFDLANEPSRCDIRISATLSDGHFKGLVHLSSK